MKTITILLFSILINGCGSANQTNASVNMKQDVNKNISGSFYISKFGNKATISEALTIAFDDSTKKVSGFSGCNRFFGTYQINDNKIAFKNLASTEMMCEEDANMVESIMMQSLSEINSFKIKNNEIIFLKGKKELLSAKQSNTPTQVKQTQSNSITFEYSEVTRGTYKMVKVNDKEVTSQFSRSEKASTKACTKTEWNNIMKLTESLEIRSISKFEPPSKAHQYDGAAHATLTITDGENTYTTQTFDGGKPPKEIAELVNSILNIATPQREKTKD